MTNNEIIKFLQSKQIPQCGDKEYTVDEEYEAYQRAIDALEQQPVITTNNDEPMTIVYPTIFCDDAVSRQAVLDAIDNTDLDFYGDEIMDAVKNLPPVQPKRQDEIPKSVIEDIRAEIEKEHKKYDSIYVTSFYYAVLEIIDAHIKAVEE